MLLHTQSLQYLKLGDSGVIAYSTPIAVAIFGRVFLGESCGVVSILLALLTFSGVCVLTRPPLLTGAEAFDTNVLVRVIRVGISRSPNYWGWGR
jgi:drug/metabolite transporter (DMT)-like permease